MGNGATETLLLPLDDRPCNTFLPQSVASLAGMRLLAPDRGLLGRFMTAGEPASLGAWLVEAVPRVPHAVISLDMLLHGGLIASRGLGLTLEAGLERLQSLRKIRQGGARLSCFGIILRSSITVSGSEDMDAWRLMPSYSELLGRRQSGDSGLEGEISRLEGLIPAEIRERYLDVRRRNHALNMAALGLVEEGVIDRLVFGQEDATPQGLHRTEQAELLAAANRSGIADRVVLLNGADELGALLVAAAASPGRRDLRLILADGSGFERPARYEDMPIKENLERHLDLLGWRVSPYGRTCLALNLPRDEEMPDLFLGESLSPGKHEPLVDDMKKEMAAGGSVSLADLAAANGSDAGLMKEMEARGVLFRLDGYAGWNTAGNTIGGVLAHLAALQAARERRREDDVRRDNLLFLLERLADDWLYQADCRQVLADDLRREGLSPYDLGEEAGRVEGRLRLLMAPSLHRLSAQALGQTGFPRLNEASWRLSLPWGRLFEVLAACSFDRNSGVK